MTGAERERVAGIGRPDEGVAQASPWYLWGPYLSERAWGTVREDYSAGGEAWGYLPHDHARSRAYRWNEDGLAGICDAEQRLCLALALWNGRDPILKERIFGLTGPEGNHGEDAKEYWWYVDAVPSSAWLSWRYHYPQREFPYGRLVEEAARRRGDGGAAEFELLDTGVFDGDRYWVVDVDYAKADVDDVLMRVRVTNAGPDADVLHVLPTLWFRNTWAWEPGSPQPRARADGDGLVASHPTLGTYRLDAASGPEGAPTPLFCDNETNTERLFGTPGPAHPKDGIGDHLVHGAPTVNPDRSGTKAALHYRVPVAAGETVELRLRLHAGAAETGWAGAVFDTTMAERKGEADEFYAGLTPPDAGAEEARVMRQAFTGMLWGKQFYPYDVARWLDGDPGQPPPPAPRRGGRNAKWRHLRSNDILSMPDPWEYPWFAAWDLAFHTVVLAHLDPAFAKYQLELMTREWLQHPNGALPAYEWAFDDVNPPVHAWAVMKVYRLDGSRDRGFLQRVFHKLLLDFAWWVNRQDPDGNSAFHGGFLGLDNVGPLDRSHLPKDVSLEQADGTAWMAFYCLSMLHIALELAEQDPAYEDLTTTFLEHFASISEALEEQGLWDPDDAFFYDVLITPTGRRVPLKVRSMVGVLPLLAATVVDRDRVERNGFARRLPGLLARAEEADARHLGAVVPGDGEERVLLSLVSPDVLRRFLAELLDEESFLSPHGIRSLSRRHLDAPFRIDVDGISARVGYEPAESRSGMFGGNSNWRGPVWMPVNYLVVEALARLGSYFGDRLTVECPTGSGSLLRLDDVAAELRRRLVSLFLPGPDGRRPTYGGVERFQQDPRWHGQTLFFEYFHGDDGAGLGASHQTGWTGLVADLITGRRLGGEGESW
ncbi:MGH1-like glycoside hydrolase domain-containing protein [Motilibacter deserti]|uniref:Glucosidase n=1 Tax=Motilibacter deserti TaxID=2714956 RepID=A0ABX0GUV9_9ACTN|nr:glucosidase [Motilibacter deserti]NHC14557.1 glucosidase [Motilibacter deserti]